MRRLVFDVAKGEKYYATVSNRDLAGPHIAVGTTLYSQVSQIGTMYHGLGADLFVSIGDNMFVLYWDGERWALSPADAPEVPTSHGVPEDFWDLP